MTRIDHSPALYMVAFAALVSPLLLGSVHFWVAVGLLVWLLVASFLTFGQLSGSERRAPRLSLVSMACLIAGAMCVLQVIPLPGFLLGLVSPTNQGIFEAGAAAAGLDVGGLRTISLSPSETADRAVRFLTIAAAVFVVTNLKDRSTTWRVLVGVLIAAALMSLLVGYVHRAIGATEFYGFYEAKRLPKMSAFVNSNHASSLFGAAALVALAICARMARTEKRGAAVALGTLGIGLFIAMMEAESSGALLAFLVSATLFMGLFLSRVLARHRPIVFGVSVGIAVMSVLIPIVFDSLNTLSSAETRVELMFGALSGSRDFWLVGAGAGATEFVIPRYTDWSLIQDHGVPTIENELAEWILTLGWPVGLVVCGLLTMMLWGPKFEEARSERRHFFSSLYVAMAAYFLAIASMHFPFLALGLSLPCLIALEAVGRQVHHAHHRDIDTAKFQPGDYPYWILTPRVALGLLLATSVAAIAMVGAHLAYTLPPITEDLATEKRLRITPSDSRLYFALAQEARRGQQLEQAVSLAEQAVACEPTARMKLFLAFNYARGGRYGDAQALHTELVQNPHALSATVRAAASYMKTEDLAALVAEVPNMWHHAAVSIQQARGAYARAEFALELAGLKPEAAESSKLVVDAYLQLKNFDVAEIWARSMVASQRRDLDGNLPGYGIWVNVLLQAGKKDEALKVANQAIEIVPGDPHVSQAILRFRTADPKLANQAERDQVRLAHKAFCTSDRAGAAKQLCLGVEAWIAEGAEDIDGAEEALRKLADRFQNPVPLADLLHRHGRCVTLRGLERQWRDRSPTPRLSQLAESCR